MEIHKSLGNFGVGVGVRESMNLERSLRRRVPRGHDLPNFGKSLAHHQVLPAVQALRTANQPRIDAIKRGLTASAMAGHPALPAIAKVASKVVGQVSPHDAKTILAGSISKHLGYTPHAKSLIAH